MKEMRVKGRAQMSACWPATIRSTCATYFPDETMDTWSNLGEKKAWTNIRALDCNYSPHCRTFYHAYIKI